MKPITMKIQFQNRHTYVLTLRTKTTLIVGDSASGKTTLIQCATDAQLTEHVEGALEFVYTKGMDIDKYLEAYPNTKYILVDEESVSAMLRERKRLVNKLWKKNYVFLFISRQPITEIQYGYRDVYELCTTGSVTELIPHFQSYDRLPIVNTYGCEDEGSGLDYFKNYINAETIGGNRNWRRGLKYNCLILDGAAVGPLLQDIIKKTQTLYLPLSFEYLLLRYYSGTTVEFVEESALITDLTLEQTCERIIADKDAYPDDYSKDSLQSSKLHARLLPEVAGLVDNNLADTIRDYEIVVDTSKASLRNLLNSVLLNLGYIDLFTAVFDLLPETVPAGTLIVSVVYALHDLGVKEFK